MAELRDEIARVIYPAFDEPLAPLDNPTSGTEIMYHQSGYEYARRQALKLADAILSLPRIQEALKALEEQEAMDRKLGHSAKCR